MTKETEWCDPETGEVHVFETTDDCIAFFRKRAAGYETRRAPAIRPDTIEMWSPVTGKVVTSKSRHYKEVRRAGCEINPEAGIRETNRPEFKSPGLADDIRRAIQLTQR